MKKPIIAVDIDDVLAQGTEALRHQVNLVTGADLRPEHYLVKGEYWGYYENIWQQHSLEVDFSELNKVMVTDQSHVEPYSEAATVLRQLSKQYQFVVITARNIEWQEATIAWLDRNFPNVFTAVYFAGNHNHDTLSKGQLCKNIGAQWLIDDNIGHAHTAVEQEVNVILFGEYGWHIDKEVHQNVIRCRDWNSVLECLGGR